MALIAVHGVAEQKPGDTAQALADLLVVAGPHIQAGALRYELAGSDAIGLRVAALAPSASARRAWQPSPHAELQPQARPRAADLPLGQRLAKAWRQSIGSDLHRLPRAAPAHAATGADAPGLHEPDIEFTDFLLAQSQRSAMPDAVFDTQRLSLQRHDAGGGVDETLHVYEMYWADLSRLAGNVPRILTELFTLIARLSQLGRDTVAAATRQYRDDGRPALAWRALDAMQATLDWLFSRLLAQLMLQLLVIVMAVAPLGWLVAQPQWQGRVAGLLVGVLPAVVWLTWIYRRVPALPRMLAGLALAVALGWALLQLRRADLLAGAWLALLLVFVDWLLGICDARFPMTRLCGRVMGALSLATVVVGGVFGSNAAARAAQGASASASTASEPERLLLYIAGALRAMEWLLLGSVAFWVLVAPAMLAWLLLGWYCDRSRGYAGAATVATGRLGLFASMAFFMTLVMGGWALLHPLMMLAVQDMQYAPKVFVPVDLVNDGSAAAFLISRYQNSTETFSVLAVLLFLVVLYLVVGLLPSLLAELSLLTDHPLARQPLALGRWLTRTLRWLDAMMKGLISAAVAVVVVVAGGLLLSRMGLSPTPLLRDGVRLVRALSQEALSPLTLAVTAASATAALTALGGLLSRYVPGLRAPLDLALDVDNHFREFPRRGIPRSRIFARYAALLRHVHEQGYERIVIVAHSQGTVISAELLRYLQARAAHAEDTAEAAALGRALAARVHLMTAGCPLRQLYASRFPVLYPWVMKEQAKRQGPEPAKEPANGPVAPHAAQRGVVGPSVAAIGVQRWVNVYATGDYVGRWLWSRAPHAGHDRSDTLVDERLHPLDVYRLPASAAAALAQLQQAGAQLDVCLGCGAHTHYFDVDQWLVAALVDGLAMSPWPPLPESSP